MKKLAASAMVMSALFLTMCERTSLYEGYDSSLLSSLPLLNGSGTPLPGATTYIFAGGTINGMLGPRANVDTICQTIQTASYPSLTGLTVKAFISISAGDDIASLVPPANQVNPVMGIKTSGVITPIALNWADLWDGTILNSLMTATDTASSLWWSGSYVFGAYDVGANCLDWVSFSGADMGRAGDTATVAGGLWVNSSTPLCSNGNGLMCVAY